MNHYIAELIRLRHTYKHQVDIPQYLQRLRAGEAPRPEDVPNGASWVKRRNKSGQVRTFGFLTAQEAEAFRARWVTVSHGGAAPDLQRGEKS